MLITNFHGMSIDDFKREYQKSKLKRDAERWLALKMIVMGNDIHFVSSVLGHDERTIKQWIDGFNERGSSGIKYNAPEGQKKS